MESSSKYDIVMRIGALARAAARSSDLNSKVLGKELFQIVRDSEMRFSPRAFDSLVNTKTDFSFGVVVEHLNRLIQIADRGSENAVIVSKLVDIRRKTIDCFFMAQRETKQLLTRVSRMRYLK